MLPWTVLDATVCTLQDLGATSRTYHRSLSVQVTAEAHRNQQPCASPSLQPSSSLTTAAMVSVDRDSSSPKPRCTAPRTLDSTLQDFGVMGRNHLQPLIKNSTGAVPGNQPGPPPSPQPSASLTPAATVSFVDIVNGCSFCLF